MKNVPPDMEHTYKVGNACAISDTHSDPLPLHTVPVGRGRGGGGRRHEPARCMRLTFSGVDKPPQDHVQQNCKQKLL